MKRPSARLSNPSFDHAHAVRQAARPMFEAGVFKTRAISAVVHRLGRCCFIVCAAGTGLLLISTDAFAKRVLHNTPSFGQSQDAAMGATMADAMPHAASAAQFAASMSGTDWTTRIVGTAIAVLVGALAGAFFSQKMRRFRRYLLLGGLASMAASLAWAGLTASDVTSQIVGFIVGAGVAWFMLRQAEGEQADTTLGSARWASVDELREHGIVADERTEVAADKSATDKAAADKAGAGHASAASAAMTEGAGEGLFLGCLPSYRRMHRMHYRGDRHLLSIAPNRSGKGTTAIVPNLLTYDGSTLVIDPKGENAMMTATRRGAGNQTIPGMKQAVHILDPWGIAKVPNTTRARFNPMDWIVSDPANATENAMLLADSIVPVRDGKEQFWDDEARALLTGLILYIAFDPAEDGTRTLGRLRDIIVMGEEELARTLARMTTTPDPVARSTAARTITKDEKLRSNVLATAQSHTHFLDSPVIRDSLSRSDFKFEELKSKCMTVYLVLPADRLDAFGRWLRILVQQAITVNARNIDQRPSKPILFLLDEMAALGRLAMVERAFGLMAGFGIQLWGIFQDAAQAKRIYGDGWETFVGNAGVVQYFGSRDHTTAEYFSKLCGVTTIKKFSLSQAIVSPFTVMGKLLGKSSELQPQSTTQDIVQRQLAYPDELMRLRDPSELVFIEGCHPVMAYKLAWFHDPLRRHLGRNLREVAQAAQAQPPVAASIARGAIPRSEATKQAA